ncbi:MAG: hypothetical protein CFE21_04825 [Bacteroidetes bacterium B1(2017)]|nr:MAG: hypothetical protein CFE21_04825 [Bacteroidetes bacterium B1(2017)]
MARTIRISKSKALNFKKLTFLYLIFIVFFFFSTSGDFVRHFIPLSNTQAELNKRYLEKLTGFDSNLQDELTMKKRALATYEIIHGLNLDYAAFVKETGLKGEKLKEKNFAKKHLFPDKESLALHVNLSEFVLGFPAVFRGGLCTDLGLDISTLTTQNPIRNNFFIETPDGAIGSILCHMETVVLSQTLAYLGQQLDEGKNAFKVIASSDSSFLQGFKDVYYVGEDITFDFFSRDSIAPTVRINQVSMTPNYKGLHYKINWTPTKVGQYELEANIGEDYIRRSFKVIKPSLRFLENEQELAAYIGEPLSLTVDLNGLERIRNLSFTSNGADIENKNGELLITPQVEGRFTIEMRSNGEILDNRSMFARKGQAPEVVLKDVAGQKTEFAKAHCLESLSANWQVVNFNMTLIRPDGTISKTKSRTRFLRNELRSIEASAPAGSTLIFDEIRLLNSNGTSTTMGAPIFIGK